MDYNKVGQIRRTSVHLAFALNARCGVNVLYSLRFRDFLTLSAYTVSVCFITSSVPASTGSCPYRTPDTAASLQQRISSYSDYRQRQSQLTNAFVKR